MEILVHHEYRKEDVEQLFDIEQLANLVLQDEVDHDNAEVAITFVDNDSIRNLNAQYRNIDAITDVLSFECDGVEVDDFYTNCPENMPFELGDIFVAVDRAEEQAPLYGLSFAEEVSLLITHGLLHLAGYDHIDDEDAIKMERRETELLSRFWGTSFKRSKIED